jgi:hypothetical protein
MRIAGVEKAGFYPTPPETLGRVKEILRRNAFHLRGRTALDPCAGEGEALAQVGRALGMRTHGIELEAERAERAAQVLDKVHQGDALRWTARGYSLLWLNPPYDYGDGMRLEKAFLRRYLESVLPGGVMVLLVPERVLGDLWPTLTRAYEPRLVARLPRGEYEVFKQAVVIAERVPPSSALSRPYPGGDLPHLENLPLEIPLAFREHLTKLKDSPRLLEEAADPRDLLARARTSPLWAAIERKSRPTPRPLLPLKKAHLALLVAGGALDLERVEMGGQPYLLLGVLKKDKVEIKDEEAKGTRVEQEVFQMRIRALNLETGEVLEVE